MRIDRLAQEFDLQLRWTMFPLHPDTPDDGMSFEELFAGRLNVADAMARLRTVAAEVGLPLADRTHTYNSRRAQELGKWADDLGRGEAFRRAVFQGYFVEGLNLARLDALTAIAAVAGLPVGKVESILADGHYAAAVDADWQRARALGVTAVPTHVYRHRGLVGFQPYEALRQLIHAAPGEF